MGWSGFVSKDGWVGGDLCPNKGLEWICVFWLFVGLSEGHGHNAGAADDDRRECPPVRFRLCAPVESSGAWLRTVLLENQVGEPRVGGWQRQRDGQTFVDHLAEGTLPVAGHGHASARQTGGTAARRSQGVSQACTLLPGGASHGPAGRSLVEKGVEETSADVPLVSCVLVSALPLTFTPRFLQPASGSQMLSYKPPDFVFRRNYGWYGTAGVGSGEFDENRSARGYDW
jgi:hypothetical protein